MTLLLLAAAGLPVATLRAQPTPRSVVDGTGQAVVLPARATRIVALAPELAELAALLGAGEAIVGRCDACDRPPELLLVPSVGPIVQPSIEGILSLRPDLVLASSQGNPLEIVRRLRELGVTTFGVAPGAPGLAGVVHEIHVVGDALGRADRAAVLANEMEERLAALRVLTASRERVRACLLVWTDPIIAAGEGSFLADLLDAAGADNACAVGPRLGVAGAEYPRLSREDLLLARPDVLLLAMHEASGAAFEGWGRSIPAVRDGSVVALDPDLYLRPSPALAAAAESLAAILHARSARAAGGARP